jgi:hypothetical protein
MSQKYTRNPNFFFFPISPIAKFDEALLWTITNPSTENEEQSEHDVGAKFERRPP